MSVDVFISYCREDIAVVEQIAALLEQQFVVWWDHDLVGGTDYKADIFEKIDKTRVALVVWSAKAATSRWVVNESRAAVRCTTCIPILLDRTPLPPHLAHVSAVDLRTRDGTHDVHALQKLARDIALYRARATKSAASNGTFKQLLDDRKERIIGGAAVAIAVLLLGIFLVGQMPDSVFKPMPKNECSAALLDRLYGRYDGSQDKPIRLSRLQNLQLRPLSRNEWAVASGCQEDDWRLFQSKTVVSGIQAPPFFLETSSGEWGPQTKELLNAKKYDEARSLVASFARSDPAARNLLAVLDANGVGHGSDSGGVFLNFREAAEAGYMPALVNMGISYTFGFDVPIDSEYGGKLLELSIQAGFHPEKVSLLLNDGISSIQVTDFPEVIKSIHLINDLHTRLFIEGNLAAIGISKEPCAPVCLDRAVEMAKELKSLNRPELAAVVEANANNRSIRAAFREARGPNSEARRPTPTEVLDARRREGLERAAEEISEMGKMGVDPVAAARSSIRESMEAR
jgi:hypothetical protein